MTADAPAATHRKRLSRTRVAQPDAASSCTPSSSRIAVRRCCTSAEFQQQFVRDALLTHAGFSRAIRRISSRSSFGIGGRPGRDFLRLHRRKPARCQRISVSGWTTTNADRQSNHRDRSVSVTRVAASTRLGFTPAPDTGPAAGEETESLPLRTRAAEGSARTNGSNPTRLERQWITRSARRDHAIVAAAGHFRARGSNFCGEQDLKLSRLLDKIDAWAERSGKSTEVARPERFAPTVLDDAPRLHLDLTRSRVGTILWASGCRPDYSWLHVPALDRKDQLRHDGGIVDVPGLYVLGLSFLRRRKSSFIHGAEDDARHLSAHIAQYLRDRAAERPRLSLTNAVAETNDNLSYVIGEIELSPSTGSIALAQFENSCASCFQAHRVTLTRIFLSRDGSALC